MNKHWNLISRIWFATLFLQTLANANDLDVELRRVAPHACGIALAEVKSQQRVDERGGDGPLYLKLTLSIEESTGQVENPTRITIGHGGHTGPPDGKPNKNAIPGWSMEFQPVVGERYWFAFVQLNTLSPLLVQVRQSTDPRVATLFHAAVRRDALKWKPIYSRDAEVQLEHLVVGPNRWKVRVTKDGTGLWSKEMIGEFRGGLTDFGFFPGIREVSASARVLPKEGIVVRTTTRRVVDANSPVKSDLIKEGTYDFVVDFDPLTGKKCVEYVYRHLYDAVVEPVRIKQFDRESGELVQITYRYGRRDDGYNGWIEQADGP